MRHSRCLVNGKQNTTCSFAGIANGAAGLFLFCVFWLNGAKKKSTRAGTDGKPDLHGLQLLQQLGNGCLLAGQRRILTAFLCRSCEERWCVRSLFVDDSASCAVYFNSCFQKPREAVAGDGVKTEGSSSPEADVLA